MNKIVLTNGYTIPLIGIGPGSGNSLMKSKFIPNNSISLLLFKIWNKFFRRPQKVKYYTSSIISALRNGFELIDYSAAYGDASLIGKAIKKSGIKRENIFITTRVSNKAQLSGNIEDEFFEQLRNLQTDYVDLLMFHWPVTDNYIDTYKKMIELKNLGYARNIGVANCHEHHLKALIEATNVIPAVNQFEIHPLFTQKPLINYCKNAGIVIEAYTPIARYDDRLMRLPKLKKIAEKYNKTTTQIVLRWHIQNGIIPIVRTYNKHHQIEDLNIFDFELTNEEMEIIDSININSRLRYNPDNCDFSIL